MAEPNEQSKSPTPTNAPAATISPIANVATFPYPWAAGRLANYDYYSKLFLGEHFNAFGLKIDNDQWGKAYGKLRYVMVNFAGLVSKIVADMLFSEPLTIKAKNDKDQEFVDALVRENKLDTQFYESALSNSYNGDAVFKVRTGKRRQTDKNLTVIIEDINPAVYFPFVDPFNVRAEPTKTELAWVFNGGDSKDYLRKEIHENNQIKNEIYRMEGQKVKEQVDLGLLGIPELLPVQATGIERPLIQHVPNWKPSGRYFGLSDYFDLDNLFYAINNRMTSVDNILDKHSDPILMVPPGILDEKGRVKKKSLGVVEMGEGENGKPEYIVWDASLENAFKEIEKLVEFIYMIGEISPDVLGLGEGVSDSGRALKFKLMRTIAKVSRKKLYYDAAIKEAIYVAMQLAKEYNLSVDGVSFSGKPEAPEITWQDGLPIDESEQIDTESKAIDAGITTEKDAIMRVYKVDEKTAEQMAKDIKESKAVPIPGTSFGDNPFTKKPVAPGAKPPALPPKAPPAAK